MSMVPFQDLRTTGDTNTSTTCSTMRSKLRSNERSWSDLMHKEVDFLLRDAVGKLRNGHVPLVV